MAKEENKTQMRRVIMLIMLVVVWLSTYAQVNYSVDSMRVANAEWSEDTMEGFYLKRYHF